MDILMKSKPILFHNSDFQTIQIKVLFPFEEDIEQLANISLLPSMLHYMNEIYPSEEEFQLAKKELYILSLRCSKTIIGTTGCFVFNLVVPTIEALGKNLLEKQIQFLHDVIYRPLIIDDGFSSFELEREKKNLENGISNAFKNMHSYQDIHIRKYMDTDGFLSRDIAWHPDLISQVTPKSIYKYYYDNIVMNQPVVYIMGDDKNDEIFSLCQKHLYSKKYSDVFREGHFHYFLKPREQVLTIEEDTIFKDSSLSIVYKVKDMKKEDKVMLLLVRDLLSSLSSRLLSQKLRDERDLIYSSKVIAYPHYGAFEITAFIQKKHRNEVERAIYEVIEDIQKEDIIDPLFQNIKERKRINLIRKLDNKYLLFEDFILHDLGIDLTMEENYEIVQNISTHELCSFIKRFQLDTVYFLKESENHE